MKWRKIIAVILSVLLFCGLSAASSSYPLSGLSLTGYSLQSIRPSSLHSLTGTVTVKVNNKGKQRSFHNVSAVLYQGGKKVASGRCSDMVFPSGQSESRVTAQIQIAREISIFTAIATAFSFKPSEYTADVVCAIVDADGRAETFVRRGIPLGNYIK